MNPKAIGERAITVTNELGLHLRAAAVFIDRVKRFKARVTVAVEGDDKPPANAGSLVGLMALKATRGTRIVIRAVGEDAEEAVAELAALVEGDFKDL
ncbi:MAG: HPr family phosphocarrier protein [Bacillota bacterium]